MGPTMVALIVGGYNGDRTLKYSEVFPISNHCDIPNLPKEINGQPSLILTYTEQVLLCGGYRNLKNCLILNSLEWSQHSTLIDERSFAAGVTLSSGIFLFGGYESNRTWEWLPTGSLSWRKGVSRIPFPGFADGCATHVSGTKIVLIGGRHTERRILMFDVDTGDMDEIGELNVGRIDHACTKFQDEIVVSGGLTSSKKVFYSTELINVRTGSARVGPDMNYARRAHGLVVAHLKGLPTVFAVGGSYYDNDGRKRYLDSTELLDNHLQSWTMFEDSLSERKYAFGYLSVPSHLVYMLKFKM